MSSVAIRAEGLGKRYRIGAVQERYHTLRDAIVNAAEAPFRLASRLARGGGGDDHIWALKDVSFEIKRGEVVGVIGRNGAGKTTLLKVLSRITEPTEGRAEIRGRVGSLLEVGTGFHPELTGRENIFLNGAILGMKRREIRAKFDEIVAFAEVEKFIDTPVKRYSSGMQVRLAFAVAAHLEPEILLVDEVLAVGDIAFQKKCLGKMGEVAGEGRTVLFVSHNMGMIRNLCELAIMLKEGRIAAIDTTADVIEDYLRDSGATEQAGVVCFSDEDKARWANDIVRLEKVCISQDGEPISGVADARKPLGVDIHYVVKRDVCPFRVKLRLTSLEGVVLHTDDTFGEQALESRQAGAYVSSCRIPSNLLNVKRYDVVIGVDVPAERILIPFTTVMAFSVTDTSGNTKYDRNWPGAVRPHLQWKCEHK